MTASTEPQTDFQRLIVERALALAREVESTAGSAPNGQILDCLESLLLIQGRTFLTDTLEAIIQQTANEAVKKGGSRGRATARTTSVTRAVPTEQS